MGSASSPAHGPPTAWTAIRGGQADLEERIALAAATGYRAPATIRADRITVAGLRLPYSNSDRVIPRVNRRAPTVATPIAVAGYTNAGVKAGVVYGRVGSGVVRATRANATPALASRGAFILENGRGVNRYPPRSGPAGSGLSRPVVDAILQHALGVANQARAQIRNPRNSRAQVTVSVVDVRRVLGLARSAMRDVRHRCRVQKRARRLSSRVATVACS